jgi:hypothetical protein
MNGTNHTNEDLNGRTRMSHRCTRINTDYCPPFFNEETERITQRRKDAKIFIYVALISFASLRDEFSCPFGRNRIRKSHGSNPDETRIKDEEFEREQTEKTKENTRVTASGSQNQRQKNGRQKNENG